MSTEDNRSMKERTMENQDTETETVEELTPEHTGRWLVTTRGSKHVFDLTRMTYTRIPGAGRGQFIGDGTAQRIWQIGVWPVVGQSFYVEFDDPLNPVERVQTRLSSTVQSIERMDETPP